MKKVLIIRFSSIGDIVLTTPVIRCVKQQLNGGDNTVHFLTKEQFVPLLKANPYIDELKTIRSKVAEISEELKAEEYDFVIDLHHNLRSMQVKKALGVPSASFNKLNFEKWLYVNLGINRLPAVHIVDRYMETVKHLGVSNDGKGLDYFIPEGENVRPETLPPEFQNDYVAFAIGGQHKGKILPVRKIVDICSGLSRPVILLGGPEDKARGDEIASQAANNVFNACGKYSINQSASLLKQSMAVVTHDTGLMHIAAALKKKVVSVWGATVPELGMYPYMPGEGSVMIRPHGIRRPYSKLGNRHPLKPPFRGMEKIDVQEVVRAVEG